jgi:hypothetical protein
MTTIPRGRTLALAALSLASVASAFAAPACQKEDEQELCRIAQEMLTDNPRFGDAAAWTKEAQRAMTARQAARRERARTILYRLETPTWRDLYNAGYTIFYSKAPEDRLLAMAVAIRALSLAPDEPDTHHLVAMTVDEVSRSYVGAQLYGRQKFFKLNPATSEIESKCLPQMLDPPLPPSVGLAFEAPPQGFGLCPKGVGEEPLAPPIAGAKR